MSQARTGWTFLTNHARALLQISQDTEVRLRDVAEVCGLTERSARAIVADLETAGYLTHSRRGRRNHYQLVGRTQFRHPAEAHQEISGLLGLFARSRAAGGPDLSGPSAGEPR
ncbi:AsnC family transcriptional regulator [Kitasatospora sp. NPDC002227]|uniref:AsnC family transcriptional regulator n=1 Tax=Kitasatospora sp. NPDC002227 TaxID=3154773 RepID=UPI003318401E